MIEFIRGVVQVLFYGLALGLTVLGAMYIYVVVTNQDPWAGDIELNDTTSMFARKVRSEGLKMAVSANPGLCVQSCDTHYALESLSPKLQ